MIRNTSKQLEHDEDTWKGEISHRENNKKIRQIPRAQNNSKKTTYNYYTYATI